MRIRQVAWCLLALDESRVLGTVGTEQDLTRRKSVEIVREPGAIHDDKRRGRSDARNKE